MTTTNDKEKEKETGNEKKAFESLRASIAAVEQDAAASKQPSKYVDLEVALEVCREAIAAAEAGNYGVAAVLLDSEGKEVARGQNHSFYAEFRSDLHAEMVVLSKFEAEAPRYDMRGFTLVSSLEPCPMCLSRILIAGVENVKFVSPDEWGGMVSQIKHLPPAFRKLAERVTFVAADVPDTLREIASDTFQLNLESLRSRLWRR